MRIIQIAAAYEGQMLRQFKTELDGHRLTVGDFLKPPVGEPYVSYVLTSLRNLGFNLGAFERRIGTLGNRWSGGDMLAIPLKNILQRSRDIDTGSLKQFLGQLYSQEEDRTKRPACSDRWDAGRFMGAS